MGLTLQEVMNNIFWTLVLGEKKSIIMLSPHRRWRITSSINKESIIEAGLSSSHPSETCNQCSLSSHLLSKSQQRLEHVPSPASILTWLIFKLTALRWVNVEPRARCKWGGSSRNWMFKVTWEEWHFILVSVEGLYARKWPRYDERKVLWPWCSAWIGGKEPVGKIPGKWSVKRRGKFEACLESIDKERIWLIIGCDKQRWRRIWNDTRILTLYQQVNLVIH